MKCGRGETQAEMAERGGGGGGLHAQRERGPYTGTPKAPTLVSSTFPISSSRATIY